jgi:hypothetical protein
MDRCIRFFKKIYNILINNKFNVFVSTFLFLILFIVSYGALLTNEKIGNINKKIEIINKDIVKIERATSEIPTKLLDIKSQLFDIDSGVSDVHREILGLIIWRK